jgi:hypothetical protein
MLYLIALALAAVAYGGAKSAGASMGAPPAPGGGSALLTPKAGQYWRLYFSLSRAMTDAEKAAFEKSYVAGMAPWAEVIDGAFKQQAFPGSPPVNYLLILLHYTKDPPGAFKMGRDNALTVGDLTAILETVTPVPADYREPL